ncbi:hypothetical protein [uncultured Corynebacterium sp.]|uniref:hypothetical protein n=1 Tax=uncultured Corynebacterium sp. TaxID=159447 RepID=UPI0025D31519|nr:hypothetical protein [uncultured Corynebacterium sp.]
MPSLLGELLSGSLTVLPLDTSRASSDAAPTCSMSDAVRVLKAVSSAGGRS